MVDVSTWQRLLDAEETSVDMVNNARLVVALSPDEPLVGLGKTDVLCVESPLTQLCAFAHEINFAVICSL